jgi:L-asparaginase/Glu-tRNA(Gln) amidotransferase subunit D
VEYETARTFKDLDVMFLRDMTTEAAYAKMSFLLGLSDDPSWVRREMTRPMAGEVTEEDGD